MYGPTMAQDVVKKKINDQAKVMYCISLTLFVTRGGQTHISEEKDH